MSSSFGFLLRFRRGPIAVGQLVLVGLSYWGSFFLRFDGALPQWASAVLWQTLPVLVAIRAVTFVPFRLYQGLWKYTGFYDLQPLGAGVLASSAVFSIYLISPIGPTDFPRSVVVIDALLITFLLGAVRLVRRMASSGMLRTSASATRVLIYGAGDAGQMIAREMKNQPALGYVPVGFVDDDPRKIGRVVHGVRVLPAGASLRSTIMRVRPAEILLAMPAVEPERVQRIVRNLESFKLPIKTLPPLQQLVQGKTGLGQVRTLSIDDLLSRPPVGLDPSKVRDLVNGRRVLVTGAGGSIGSELCRQIAALGPATLVLLDRYENGLHDIRLQLSDLGLDQNILVHAAIGDVTDEILVDHVFRSHDPEIVFHAAAHKHVPLMEENPCEAVKNNVRGTKVVALAAERCGVDRFILISTDKAANPSSVMGATKRLAELAVQAIGRNSGTSFSIVRFGNVLGSNGSVVPRFLSQIQRGGPVTVTHPEVRRYFMLIPEAVQLVLHAAAHANSGGTFVLEMGEQVKIVDVARNVIRLAGYVPDKDIEISFVGLRAGEKIEETLIGSGEGLVPSEVPKVLRVTRPSDSNVSLEVLDALISRAEVSDRAAVYDLLRELTGLGIQVDREAPVPPASPLTSPRPSVNAEWPGAVPQGRCPHCQGDLFRSRAKRLDQHLRKRLTSKRLHRCEKCGRFAWIHPMSIPVQATGADVSTPDLVALDAGSSRVTPSRRFSPKDLHD